MKVTLVNTYPHGGAGIACRRLETALHTQGVETQMLFRDGNAHKWPFYAERLSFLPHERDKSVRFSFSLANFGTDLRKHPAIQWADVIHLHWVNQGFLSIQNVRQLAGLGKPIFWTLHDMWAFTGGCHYARGCTHFLQQCGHCNFVKKPSANDLSHRIWLKKQANFPKNIHFITCSQWLQKEAKRSGLLKGYQVDALPNPIDTAVFQPISETQRQLRRQSLGISPNAKVLLFVAMKVSETRKGFHHLLEALYHLKTTQPDQPFEILVLGKTDPEALLQLPYPTHALGMVTDPDTLAAWYGTADAFVIPSLEDNLPNTVMESLACGTPVAGFQTGGIPEMVEHGKQGAIVPQGDTLELAHAIYGLTYQPDILQTFRAAARSKVENHYSLDVVGKQHLALYQKAMNA